MNDGGKIALLQNINSRLGTIETARDAFGEIIEAYGNHEITERNVRAFGYVFGVLLNYLRAESDLKIEERITELEKMLAGVVK